MSKHVLSTPKMLLLAILTCVLVPSCGTTTRSLPTSSTQVLRDTSGEVERKLCEGLKPDPIPLSLVEAMNALPDPGDEPADVYRSRLAPEQRAILDAYNKAATDGALWLGICRKGDV